MLRHCSLLMSCCAGVALAAYVESGTESAAAKRIAGKKRFIRILLRCIAFFYERVDVSGAKRVLTPTVTRAV
jgi:hypothetical protein